MASLVADDELAEYLAILERHLAQMRYLMLETPGHEALLKEVDGIEELIASVRARDVDP